jgi:hypothetical protein
MSSENGEVRSYYGQPVIKEPVWKWEIPVYMYTGGLAGASSTLAYLAELRGNDVLARRAWFGAFCGIGVSPLLLISDLGRPSRFLNMLRVFKVTSPMSSGAWILTMSGVSIAVGATDAWTALFPRAGRIARPVAAFFGLPLSTYTAALITNTAVPVWHEARGMLAPVFASGAATSAGAVAVFTTPHRHAAPARRLALGGAVAELASVQFMEKRLGEHGEPYHKGLPATLSRAGKALTLVGAATIAARGARSRLAAATGGTLLAAGAICERWAVFRAGFASAADPKYTVGPQRRRIERGERRGASRRTPAAAS